MTNCACAGGAEMRLLRVGFVTLVRMRGNRPVESPRPGFVLWDQYLVVFLGIVPTVYQVLPLEGSV